MMPIPNYVEKNSEKVGTDVQYLYHSSENWTKHQEKEKSKHIRKVGIELSVSNMSKVSTI